MTVYENMEDIEIFQFNNNNISIKKNSSSR